MNTEIEKAQSRLGPLEQRWLSYAQFKGLTVVRFGQLREAIELTAEQERKVLSRLAGGGTIVRLKRGCYLVPPRLPLGGVWNPGEALLLRELMRVCDEGRYQLCGWPVFNRYGFTDQVAARLSAYNNRIYGDRVLAGRAFTFIKVKESRLGGTEESPTPSGTPLVIPGIARALVDAFVDWSRFGTLPAGSEWLRTAVREEPPLKSSLVKMLLRFGNQSAIRRAGYVLSNLGLPVSAQLRLRRTLRSRSSVIPLVPGRTARGRVDREWGVIDNE